MGIIQEESRWSADVYQFEVNDSVIGGTPNETTGEGKSNLPSKQLADRTKYLKDGLDALTENIDLDNILALLTRTTRELVELRESHDSLVKTVESLHSRVSRVEAVDVRDW